MSIFTRLYRHEVNYDFIGPRKRWYVASAIVVLICLASLLFRGFQLGIDFKGGASFEFPEHGKSKAVAERTVENAGARVETSQVLANTGRIRLQTPPLDENEIKRVSVAIQQEFNASPAEVSVSTVGASWGSSITKKALQGLAVFLIAVIIFISIRFEPKMALAAIISLLHDLIITAGIYSIVGFEVTPSTVIALLTILGFSLYDTVVVFDKVREDTAGITSSSKRTYAQAVNAAVNETLMRSINTSLIALMPVAALLFIGAGLLGAGTLKDLALAQFVGLAAGAYSSIFIATPLLANMKEREPRYRSIAAKVARQREARAHQAGRVPAVAAAGVAPAAVEAALAQDAPAASGTPGAATRRSPARPQGRRPAARKSSGGRPAKKRRR